ncbi:RNA-binding protein, partial [Candidatus Micrarchaeota archaeon]|nr:RNA-binding protein [Candidatus Micrarchaeota archaeon]
MEKVLLPGDMISDKPLRVEGSFIEDGKTFASVISLMRDDKSIPLKGYYLPRPGDYIVGVISDVRFSSYSVDLNAPFDGTISTR